MIYLTGQLEGTQPKWARAHFFFLEGALRREAELDHIRTIALRVASSYGLDVFDVQYRRESIGWVLRIILDRPVRIDSSGQILPRPPADDAVSIDECRRVSEDVSAILDVEDPLDHAYTLEVSSPGLDRPLRNANDYRRFVGRLAKIVVAEPVDGQKHFAGRLRGLEDRVVVLEEDRGRTRRIPIELIARARLEVEF